MFCTLHIHHPFATREQLKSLAAFTGLTEDQVIYADADAGAAARTMHAETTAAVLLLEHKAYRFCCQCEEVMLACTVIDASCLVCLVFETRRALEHESISFHCHFLHSFWTCARQAQQAWIATYWSSQLSPTSLVLCYPKPFILSMRVSADTAVPPLTPKLPCLS